MQTLLLKRPGSILDIGVNEIETPVPQKGEVLVRVRAASLNPLDYKMALSGNPNWKYPHTPGLDGAGTVEELGPETTGFSLGQRVLAYVDLRKHGTFAEFCTVPAHCLAVIPDNVSFEDAAALPCAGLSALLALTRCAMVRTGCTVLIQGAAGGVGGLATQIASMLGAEVWGTCSPDNFEYVRSLGAKEVIDYNRENIRDRLLAGGDGAHVSIDGIGSQSSTQALGWLRHRGHLVCLSGLPDLSKLIHGGNGFSIHDIALGNVYSHGSVEDQKQLAIDLATLLAWVSEGKIRSTKNRVIGLAEVPGALEDLRDRHVRGKTIVSM